MIARLARRIAALLALAASFAAHAQFDYAAYGTLDAQLSYALPVLDLRIKLGASNVLNQYYVSYLGGPSVGGLYYLAVTYAVK